MKPGNRITNRHTDLWIIAGFAAAHAVTAAALGGMRINDELLLTLLTMAMTVILCFRRNLNIEITAACAILVNVLGFLIGTEGGYLLGKLLHNQTAARTAATFLTTLILGFGISSLSKALVHDNSRITPKLGRKSNLRILIAAFAFIFLLRIIVFIFSSADRSSWQSIEMLSILMSNSAVVITTICINIIFVRSAGKIRHDIRRSLKWTMYSLFFIAMAAAMSFLVCLDPNCPVRAEWSVEYVQLNLLSLIVEVSVYSIVYLANYAFDIQQAIAKEREERHTAQFRYEKLKQQVNPHFLFNSLNVLDGLVQDGQNGKASEFIQKLAGLYRYMLGSEDEKMVPLSREMDFVNSYIELMRVRFPEGFEVEESVMKDDFPKCVPPCAVQMLVENAFKHNGISPDNPLRISIFTDGESITVTNTLIPKNSLAPSTGVGLKYIEEQYKDLANREVDIVGSEDEYRVKLPLLENIRQTEN
ncbi:MAG: sensor histidine kinase [Candidatus Cryptobacteroides sp.]